MNGKTLMIALVMILALYAGGCFDTALGRDNSPQPQPATIDSAACYADAQAQLSPHWASASKLDRAVAALTVISTCEGN